MCLVMAFEVATAGKAQGNEKKIVIADFTVASMTAPGYLGFLRRWNRPNVMLSRAQSVLICILNVTQFRRGLPQIHQGSPEMACLVMDLIDCGDVFTVTGGSSLPQNSKQASEHSSTWSSKQGASEHRKSKSKPQMETEMFKNGKMVYSKLESQILSTWAKKRDAAAKEVQQIEAEEAAWQLERVKGARPAEGALAAQDTLDTEMVGGELVEDAAADVERKAEEKRQARADYQMGMHGM